MNKRFLSMMAMVMGYFNIKAFEKDANNKPVLTDDQKTELEATFGKEFVAKFAADLAEYKEDEEDPNASIQAIMQMSQQFSSMKADFEQYKKTAAEEKASLMALIEKLSKSPAEANVETIEIEGKQVTRFKPNANYRHNKVLADLYAGKVAQYSGNSTIDTTELQGEFGNYVDMNRREILQSLVAETTSTKYMTTVVTDKTEWQASHAKIGSVVQQFTPYWTPSGKAEFKPLKIKNFKHKINVPIKPSDIMTDILGYLYDEKLSPDQMPIVKYINEVLVMPKVSEDREMLMLATGVFKEATVTKDYDTASPAQDSMDGYVTILKKLKAANTEIGGWLIPGVTLTDENILEQVDIAVKSVSPLYKRKKLPVFADPDLITTYGQAYRAKYPYTKNEDGEKMKIDFTNFTFVPLDGMQGTGVFFITPPENFKHLISQNADAMSYRIETQNYDVKVFAEWWEAVGFALAEAIFAYLPPEAPAGSTGGGI